MFAATLLTLFPEMFPGPLGLSLAGDALAHRLWSCEARDIRDMGLDVIAPSTTRRPAAAPAWCCAPTCWLLRSTPPRRQTTLGRAC